ncbi:MAG: NAD(P)H-hydrate dehydratase [Clostridiaceae bacterium]|nr:NAD(P)H-hydrate dehydratase [Clostridiaceae bacterium]
MRTIGAKAQQTVDREAPSRLGITLHDLMIRAAEAVVRVVLLRLRDDRHPVVFVCGSGNNGGDGYAAAHRLAALGHDVSVLEAAPERPRSSLAARERALADKAGLLRIVDPGTAFPDHCLVVDAVFGAGYSALRPLDPAVSALFLAVEDARSRGATVVSVDLPSGVEADTGRACPGAVQADATVTFVRPKPGLFLYPGRRYAGRIVTDPIGIPALLVDELLSGLPDEPLLLDAASIHPLAVPRPADAHKGTFGRVLVTGGSPGMGGAATLAVGAALRSGAGLVQALVPKDARVGIDARHPEALGAAVDPFPPDPATALRLSADKQAVLVGPGLAPDPAAEELVAALCVCPSPVVLDAGALTLAAFRPERFVPLLASRVSRGMPYAVLTPHPGEFGRLAPDLDRSDPVAAARDCASRWSSVVVLKGAGTVVASPDGRCAINTTGNDGLSKAGSGDVLAGLLAGLLAQGMDPWEAACAAVCLHGMAADIAARRSGRRSMLPGDLALCFGDAFKQAGWENNTWME